MRFLLCVLGLQIVWGGAALAAQDGPTPSDEPIHTLHVYTNLIQIPTLVLGPNLEQLKAPIAESRFSVSIDSGRWFRATHVRQESDDPISLSILLDVDGDDADLMPKIGDAIASLAPLDLHSKDRVSIYALDCSLIRSLNDVPAESRVLKAGVDSVLESWTLRRRNRHSSHCKQAVHLWDALAYVVGELYQLPGRRVILAVSDGNDKGSMHSWNELRNFAQGTGVAIFGMTNGSVVAPSFLNWKRENAFLSVCELSGGLVLPAGTGTAEETLKRLLTMLRGRYIVEFPRPANSTVGRHDMLVKIAKGEGDFIRSAGVSVPIADPAVLADPTTIRSGPSLTPEQGKRQPMKDPH